MLNSWCNDPARISIATKEADQSSVDLQRSAGSDGKN